MSADNGVYILRTLRRRQPLVSEANTLAELQRLQRGIRGLLDEPVSDIKTAIFRLLDEQQEGELYEFRVQELQAVDNYSWDASLGRHNTGDDDLCIMNAREMWANSKVYASERDALVAANATLAALGRDGWPCEYGISFVEIEREF